MLLTCTRVLFVFMHWGICVLACLEGLCLSAHWGEGGSVVCTCRGSVCLRTGVRVCLHVLKVCLFAHAEGWSVCAPGFAVCLFACDWVFSCMYHLKHPWWTMKPWSFKPHWLRKWLVIWGCSLLYEVLLAFRKRVQWRCTQTGTVRTVSIEYLIC